MRHGFLVVFRLGGSICDAPAVVALNRFRIHTVPIDLGDEESGHAQPKPVHIEQDDLVAEPPEEDARED